MISGVFCTLLGLAIWFYSGTFPVLEEGHPGPSLFPRLIGTGLVIAGLALVVRGRKLPTEGLTLPDKPGLMRLLGGVAVVVIYPVLQSLSGTIAALSLSCLAIALILRLRLRTALLTAVGSALLIYAVFDRLLHVPL